jgi:hypothetical protein
MKKISSKKTTTFSTVHIRMYDITIGDSPFVSSGLPLALGWRFVDADPLSLDDYEGSRPPRRDCFRLSAEERARRLIGMDKNKTGYRRRGRYIKMVIRPNQHPSVYMVDCVAGTETSTSPTVLRGDTTKKLGTVSWANQSIYF